MNSTKKSEKQRRTFFVMMGLAFLSFGVWKYLHDKPVVGSRLLLGGAFFFVTEFLAPAFARLLFKAWMGFAQILGTINTYILLTVVFFFLITPIAWIKRLFTKESSDPEVVARQKKSAWISLPQDRFTKARYLTPY